jgi:hypothetical protein
MLSLPDNFARDLFLRLGREMALHHKAVEPRQHVRELRPSNFGRFGSSNLSSPSRIAIDAMSSTGQRPLIPTTKSFNTND